MGLPCGVECVEASSATVEGLEPFLEFDFGSDFFDSWKVFGWILGAQNGPQIDFFHVFLDVFFEVDVGIDFWLVGGCSKPEK